MEFDKFFNNIVKYTVEYIEKSGKPPAFTIFAMEGDLLIIIQPEDKSIVKEILEQLRNDRVKYIVLVGVAKMKIFKSNEEVKEKLGELTSRLEGGDSIRELVSKLEGDPDTIMVVFIIGRKKDGTTRVKNYEITLTESGKCSLVGELKEGKFARIGGNLIPEPW